MPLVVPVELAADALRLGVGRETGVRGGRRDGVDDSDGTVLDRARDEIALGGVDNADRGRW